jgi:hypothetical protein
LEFVELGGNQRSFLENRTETITETYAMRKLEQSNDSKRREEIAAWCSEPRSCFNPNKYLPLCFFFNIGFTGVDDFLHDPYVMLSFLAGTCSKGASFVQNSLSGAMCRGKEFLGEGVIGRQTASLWTKVSNETEWLGNKLTKARLEPYLVIQPSANFSISGAFFIQVVYKVGLGPATFVCDTILVVGGEEFDGRETTNLVFLGDVLVLCIIGVNVCDDTLHPNFKLYI